jgi:hypothetical protein
VAISFNTTTISVMRTPAADDDADADGYSATPPTPVLIAQGVRAVVSPPTASSRLTGGDRVVFSSQVRCDPTDLMQEDTIIDETGGLVWTVLWATRICALGQDFTQAALRMVEGASA